MPRTSRRLAGGLIYHVINRGNDKQIIFRKEFDYKAFIDLMVMAKERHPLKLLPIASCRIIFISLSPLTTVVD